MHRRLESAIHNRVLSLLPLSVLAAAATTACGGVSPDPQANETSHATTSDLYEAKGVTLFTANNNVAHVCFITIGTGPDLAAAKTIIRNAINESWARHSALRFEGFEECSNPTSTMLTWQLTQGLTPGSWGGNTAIGLGARLGAPPAAQIAQTIAPGNDMTANVAVHEVGHAIGWVHENQRPDHPDLTHCFQELNISPQNPNVTVDSNGITLTAYDPDSIMNYCYDRNRDGIPDGLEDLNDATLSALDIVGVQLAYGRPAAGSIVGLGDECIEAPSAVNGATVHTNKCKGTAAQKWLRDASYHLTSVGFPSVVLGAITPAAGSPVVVTNPPNPVQSRQQWQFNAVQVRALGDKCVEPVTLSAGSPLQINDCVGAPTQQWTVTPTGQIASAADPSLCWDDPGFSTTSGTPLQLWTCNGGSNQTVNFTGKGEITFFGLCTDVVNGQPANGARVQLFGCKSDSDSTRLNQRFHFSGPIQNSGFCLDIPSASTADNTPSQLFFCNGGANQNWDRYFPVH